MQNIKNILVLFSLISLSSSLFATEDNNMSTPGSLTPMVSYSYINKAGKLITNLEYTMAGEFSEGVAFVKGPKSEELMMPGKTRDEHLFPKGCENMFGYIDKKGNYAIKPEFTSALPFSEGMAGVSKGKIWFFINKEGKKVINEKYESVLSFREGLAPVKIGGKWGYIDKQGKIVVKPQFESAEEFSDGMAVASKSQKEKFGYIDKSGKFIIEPVFQVAYAFSEGLARVWNSSKYCFIDKTGKETLKSPSDASLESGFSEGLAIFLIHVGGGSRSGYMDKAGKIAIKAEYYYATDFSEGLAGVYPADKNAWVYIDKTGKIILETKYYKLYPFRDGIALVENYLGAYKMDNNP
jgi:hypothetical protein